MTSLDPSFFISQEVQTADVLLADGNTHKLYFKELPSASWRVYSLIERNGTLKEKSENMQRIIALSLVTPDGEQAISLDKALKLKAEVVIAIFSKIVEINNSSSVSQKQATEDTSTLLVEDESSTDEGKTD